MKRPDTVAQYIAGYPKEIQLRLKQVRGAIRKSAPKSEECISYGMPAYKWNGMLVWFAAHARHIGFYPKTTGIAAFRKELSAYKGAKGSVQFPHDKPLPVMLIARIVKFRAGENLDKALAKKR